MILNRATFHLSDACFLEPDDRVGDQNVPTSIRRVVLQKI